MMKIKIALALTVIYVLMCGYSFAELRTYRQFKDVATKENGKVTQSNSKGDLFEYTYDINMKKNTITRVKIRRLDQSKERDDATVYDMMGEKRMWGSDAGGGGDVIVASKKNGGEILVLGKRFSFTSRTSPFSQLVTGVYKRVYVNDKEKIDHKHK